MVLGICRSPRHFIEATVRRQRQELELPNASAFLVSDIIPLINQSASFQLPTQT